MMGGPIIGRELLVQARKPGLYWGRVAAALAGFFLLWILLLQPVPSNPAVLGRVLFSTLSWVAFVYCAVVGVYVTADCLSSEKREGTLRLLFLTDLRPWQVVAGKLISCSMPVAYGMVGLIPLLGVTTVFGGVAQQHLIETSLVLANTLFLSLSMGMLASTLCENDRKALLTGFLLLGLFLGSPYVAGYATASPTIAGVSLDPNLLASSPVYAFRLALMPPPRPTAPTVLSRSILFTHATAWLLLLVTSALIQQFSQDRVRAPRRGVGQARKTAGTVFPRTSAARRQRLLDGNPITWLCLQSRMKVFSAWLFLGSLTIIGCFVYRTARLAFFECALLLSGAFFVLIKFWVASEICQTWVTDKNNGAFELLLSTPLKTTSIAAGQRNALLKQFAGPIIAGILLTLLSAQLLEWAPMETASRRTGQVWLYTTIPLLVADLAALHWVALWNALTRRTLNRALFASVTQIFLWRWLFFGIFGMFFSVYIYADRRNPWIWMSFILVFGIGIDLFLGMLARSRYLLFFRSIASNPRDWKSIVADDAHSEQKGVLASKGHWIFRTNFRPMLLRAGAAILLIYGLGRLGLAYRIERKISALQAAVQAAAPPKPDALWAPPGAYNPASAITALSREIRGPVSLTSWTMANQDVVRKLHELPSLAFAIYTSPPGSRAWSDEVQGFRKIAALLRDDVVLDSRASDPAAAARSLMRLAQLCMVRDGRATIWMTGGLQVEALNLLFDAAQAFLQVGSLSLEQLKEIQEILSSWGGQPAPADHLKAWIERSISQYRGTSVESPMMMRPRVSASPIQQLQEKATATFAVLTGVPQWQYLKQLDQYAELLRIAKLPAPYRLAAATAFEAMHHPRILPNGVAVSSGPATTFRHFVFLDALNQSKLDLLRTVVAIELYRLEGAGVPGDQGNESSSRPRRRAKPPGALRDLIPRFLQSMPEDPFVGGAIHYEVLQSGYKLRVFVPKAAVLNYTGSFQAEFNGTFIVRE